MIRKRRRSVSPNALETHPLIQLWHVRLLIGLGTHKEFITDHGFTCDSIAQAIGLGDWVDGTSQEFDRKKVLIELRQVHREFESRFKGTLAPTILRDNVERLSQLVGLSQTDCRILEFAVLLCSESILDEACDRLGPLSSVKVCHVLSLVLDIAESEIRTALNTHGLLAKSGLVAVDRSGVLHLQGKLDLLSDHFADLISSSEIEPVDLLRDTVHRGGLRRPSPSATITTLTSPFKSFALF